MKEIYNVLRRGSSLFQEKSIHIMCLSFERRCLAYPQILRDLNLSAQKHSFFSIRLSDDNVSKFLQELRRENEKAMRNHVPSIQFITFTGIIQRIQNLSPPINIYIDMSGLPRQYIFLILKAIFENFEEASNVRIFCIYTYPKEYTESPLQEPSTAITYIFGSSASFQEEKISLIILPGFDIEDTNVGLTHLYSISNREPDIYWFIPFPGRTYRFYERVIESHFYFLKRVSESKIILFPQEQLRLSVNNLRKQIEGLPEPLLVMPLGCRIICISTFLSVVLAQRKKRKIDVMFPQTSIYDSLKSEGYTIPLIEEIPIDINRWKSD